jgi:ABC-type cobalamin transport system permease subunit
MSKPWYLSRTVWVNIITAVVSAAAIVSQAIYGKPVIDPAIQGMIGTFALAVVNLILRKLTKRPIT